jgi:four helix bundle protein
VWQKAHQLVLTVYQCTRSFPKDELYGLTSQMGRAAVSISANIAEGCGRNRNPDLSRFLQIAFGSACKLECETLVASDLKYLDNRTRQ